MLATVLVRLVISPAGQVYQPGICTLPVYCLALGLATWIWLLGVLATGESSYLGDDRQAIRLRSCLPLPSHTSPNRK